MQSCRVNWEKEKNMKQEERKLRVKRMLAGVMSAMMLISAADVSGRCYVAG